MSTTPNTNAQDQLFHHDLLQKKQTADRQKRTGVLSVLGAVILWSSSYVVIKVGVGDIPPLTYAAIRFMIAVVVLCFMACTVQRIEKVAKKDMYRLMVGGLFGITTYFSLQNLGVQKTTATDATLLVAFFPVIMLVFEILFHRARVNFKQIGGIAISIIGVYLVINLTHAQKAPERLAGDLLLLATGVAWALYNFATQEIVKKYSTFTVIFWQTLFGMIALLPISFAEIGQWQSIKSSGLLSAAFLGIFCSVGAFLLYGYGLKSLKPTLAVNLLNLVPVFGLIFAALFLREKIGFIQILGGLTVIGGVTLSIRTAPDPIAASYTSSKDEQGSELLKNN